MSELRDIFVSMREEFQFSYDSKEEVRTLARLMDSELEHREFNANMPDHLCSNPDRVIQWSGRYWRGCGKREDLTTIKIGDFINE